MATELTTVSETLEKIFHYYATTTPHGSRMTLTSFQKLALDSDMIDAGLTTPVSEDSLTSAQVDLIFKRVLAQAEKARQKTGKKSSNGLRHMELEQFFDAIVLLATTKYATQNETPKIAIDSLYREHFSTFNTEETTVSNDWCRALEHLAMPLFYIYKHYFPLELNPHYKLTPAESRDNVQMAFQRIMEDFEIAPKLFDKKPIVFEALRKAYKNPIPKALQQTIDLGKLGHFKGQHFTFHHFLIAMQTAANCMRKYERKDLANDQPDEEDKQSDRQTLFSARAVESLEMLLKRMDQNKRSTAPQIKLMSSEHSKDITDLQYTQKQGATKGEDSRAQKTREIILQVYNFYVTLGEPLAQNLSIRKFNRFLRDISIVPSTVKRKPIGVADGTDSGVVQQIQSSQKAPQFSLSQALPRAGGHDVDSPRMGQMLSSPIQKIGAVRKYPLDSNMNRNPNGNAQYEGPVATTMALPGIPLNVSFTFRLTQVGADLIFYQAKHEKQQFSSKPLPGYQYRRKPLQVGTLSSSQAAWTKKNKVDTEVSGFFVGSGYYKKDDDPKKPRMGAMMLDPDGFYRAIEILADKVYRNSTPQDPTESVAMFAEEILSDLLQKVSNSDLAIQRKNNINPADFRQTDWQDSQDDSEAVNQVFHTTRLALERIFYTYASNANPGWSLQTFTDFAEDFGVLRDLKMLTIHRIFYALADEPEDRPPRIYMKFEAFARSLVYLAQWAVEGEYRVAHKLLLLFHRMNATPGAVRLTNNCDLFPVIKEIRSKIPVPKEEETDAAPTWESMKHESSRSHVGKGKTGQ